MRWRAASCGILGGILVLLVFTAAPTQTWYDTGELSVATQTLGIGHPPGEALFVSLGRMCTLLPLGALPFRLGLLSVLSILVWTSCSCQLLRGLSARLEIPSHLERLTLLVVPLLALNQAVWLQAVRMEVYALHLALSGILVLLAFPLPPTRTGLPGPHGLPVRFALLSLGVGLSAANHPLLVVLLLPGLLFWMGWPGSRALAWGMALGLLGFSVSLHLPLRTNAGAALAWGTPDNLSDLLNVLLARTYQRSFIQLTLERFGSNVRAHGALLEDLLGLPVLFGGVLGLVALRRARRAVGGFVLLLCGNLASTSLQAVFFPDNPDAQGYLAFTCGLLSLLALLGSLWLLARIQAAASASHDSSRLPPGGVLALRVLLPGAVLLLLVVPPALRAAGVASHGGRWLAGVFGRDLLAPLPTGAVYLAGSDATLFSAWFQQAIHGQRPDVQVHGIYSFSSTPQLQGVAAGVLPGPSTWQALERQALPRGRPTFTSGLDLPGDPRGLLRPGRTSFEVWPASWPGVDTRGPRALDAGLDRVLEEWERLLTRRRAALGLEPGLAQTQFTSYLEMLGDLLAAEGLLEQALAAYAPVAAVDATGGRLVQLKRHRLELRLAAMPEPQAWTGERRSLADCLQQARRALARGNHSRARLWLEQGTSMAADQSTDATLLAPPGLAREDDVQVREHSSLEAERLVLLAWDARLRGDLEQQVRFLLTLLRDWPESSQVAEGLVHSPDTFPGPGMDDAPNGVWQEEVLRNALLTQLRRRPSAGLWTRLAWHLEREGQHFEAGQALQQALQLEPERADALAARGWLHVQKGQVREALVDATRALELDPCHFDALRLSANLYRQGVRQ